MYLRCFKRASWDCLGFDNIHKAAGAHPLDTLRSYFGTVVCGRGNVREHLPDERKHRTDAERMRDAIAAKYNATLRGRGAQRAPHDRLLLADPAVLLDIIEPHIPCELAEEARVEVAHRLHLVVHHRQRRVDGRGRTQQVPQDV